MSDHEARENASNTHKNLLRRALSVLTSLSPQIVKLGELFAAEGYELALVGGPVRDAFLGRVSSDLDFATSAHPDETQRILDRWGTTWDVGKAFGTIGARRGDVVVEITTFRTEEYRADSRKPEVGFGKTLDGDLSRRDFRVNSMAVRVPELEFVDPFDGLSDLANRILRTPASPEQSFSDDPLRMMRAARFAAQLDFAIAPEVHAAMTAMGERIKIVSPERIRTELEKLILAPQPILGLRALVDTGLAQYILPELPALQLEIDEHHRHKDVYEHSLDRKSTRLNSSHVAISYAVFCLKKKTTNYNVTN